MVMNANFSCYFISLIGKMQVFEDNVVLEFERATFKLPKINQSITPKAEV